MAKFTYSYSSHILHNKPILCTIVAGRETPSRAPAWAFVPHSEINCPSEETHMLTKQKTILGSISPPQTERGRVRETRRVALPCGSHSQTLWKWIRFWFVSGQSSCLACGWSGSGSFLGDMHTSRPRWIPAPRIL